MGEARAQNEWQQREAEREAAAASRASEAETRLQEANAQLQSAIDADEAAGLDEALAATKGRANEELWKRARKQQSGSRRS